MRWLKRFFENRKPSKVPVAVAPEVYPYLATEAVKVYGKMKVPFELLQTLRSDWERFHVMHPDFTMQGSSPQVWAEYVALMERMCYRAHYTYYDVENGVWMLENECGKNSWIEFSPFDYFIFEG